MTVRVPPRSLTSHGLSVALVAAVGVLMLAWSWRRWPDLLIDFGGELYVPWQLTKDKVLYADIAYLNGPLSPSLNALWFRVFGVSLSTLIACNLLLLAGLTVLLYRILHNISSRFAATLACVVFMTCFAFAQFVGNGNYNFVCPYSHELTHGIILALGAIGGLAAYHRTRRRAWIAATGLLLGLVFLTKAEVFLAAALSIPTGLGLTIWLERPDRRRRWSLIGLFLGGAAFPPLLAFLLLTRAMPADEALRGTLGTWPAIQQSRALTFHFYRLWMGTLDLKASAHSLLRWTIGYVAVLGVSALVSLTLRTPGWVRSWASAGLALLVGTVMLTYGPRTGWASDLLRPLPVAMLLLGAVTFVSLLRHRREAGLAGALIIRLTLSILAFVLLGKMALFARLYNYGFVLAMPATLLCVIALVHWVPASLTRLGGYGGAFRATALVIIWVVVVGYLKVMSVHIGRKTSPVSTGADMFWSDPRALQVNVALQEIQRLVRPDETLVVLPQGVMINYLSRRVNPTPYLGFDPFVLAMYGEERLLDSLQAAPPDYIVLAHVDTSENGARFFGRDYGQRIHAWIHERYRQERLIGDAPLRDERFGLLLLRRK